MEQSAQMMWLGDLLPNIVATETRVVTISGPELGIKPGEYVFFELYCDDRTCDCRRAMIQVRDSANHKLCATLSYAWEDLQFYIDWMHGDKEGAQEIPGINRISWGMGCIQNL